MNGTRPDEGKAGQPLGDVAIVGMSCMFADAGDPSTYWSNIVDKHVAVGDVPPGRWDSEPYRNAPVGALEHLQCTKGAFLGDSFEFDPIRVRVPPSSIAGADPDQFLVLRCAHEALADAGYATTDLEQDRTEVIIGRAASGGPGTMALWQRTEGVRKLIEALAAVNPNIRSEELSRIREELVGELPPFSAETVPGVVPNIAAGRVANRFDCMGANFIVDAACATGLVVADLAVRNLRSGISDLAVIGAVHSDINATLMVVFNTLGAISGDGVCRPFDAKSNGTVLGEGVGVLVLKRKEDAERDGDRIYALIKGIGSSSDGKSTALLSPSSSGEMLAIKRAYAASGVLPETVELIEAHGTGTEAGDSTELDVMSSCFGGTGRTQSVAVGSVKSMIGHTLVAAGVASLIKIALALHQRTLPPSANCEHPHSLLRETGCRIYVNTQARPWMRDSQGGPRRAGVSAFGFGGVNAHAVLEEYDEGNLEDSVSMHRRWPSELLVIDAASREALAERVSMLAGELHAKAELTQVACALNAKSSAAESCRRLAVVAQDVADLIDKLRIAAKRLEDPDVASINDRSGIYYGASQEAGKLALIFPGEGSPYVNAARELAVAFPSVRCALQRFDDLAATAGAERVAPILFPPPPYGDEALRSAEQNLQHPHRSAPVVRAVNLAMLQLTRAVGMQAEMVCGHSAGEWVAMVAGGIIPDDAVPALHGAIGRSFGAVSDVASVALFAVGIDQSRVDSLGHDSGCPLVMVNDNCPHQVVLAVAKEEENRFASYCRAERIIADKLPFDRPFHSDHYAPLVEPLRSAVTALGLASPRIPTYSCTTGELFPCERDGVLELFCTAPARPVLFRRTVERMYLDGARIFVEVGPREVLTGFVRDILADKPHHALSLDRAGAGGIAGLLHGLGRLAALGVPMDLRFLHRVRAIEPNGPTRHSTKPINVSLAPPRLAIDKLTAKPKSKAAASGSRVPEGRNSNDPSQDRTRNAMDEYFDTMEAFVTSQENVMNAYLASKESGTRQR